MPIDIVLSSTFLALNIFHYFEKQQTADWTNSKRLTLLHDPYHFLRSEYKKTSIFGPWTWTFGHPTLLFVMVDIST